MDECDFRMEIWAIFQLPCKVNQLHTQKSLGLKKKKEV